MIKMTPLLKSALPILAVAMFQVPANPPMKLGLWEMKGTVKISQPHGTDKTMSRVIRNCFTPDNWLKLMGPTASGACPKTNEAWSKDNYSFDVECSGKPKMASINIHFDNQETQHGIADVFTTPDGTPTKMHQEFEGRWVNAECGDVSPDHPVIVR
jgi:hypothetical protein